MVQIVPIAPWKRKASGQEVAHICTVSRNRALQSPVQRHGYFQLDRKVLDGLEYFLYGLVKRQEGDASDHRNCVNAQSIEPAKVQPAISSAARLLQLAWNQKIAAKQLMK